MMRFVSMYVRSGETLLRELPVIEVHQMASRFSSDDEIEIVQAGDPVQISRYHCPAVAATGTWDSNRSDLLTLPASQPHLKGDGIVMGCGNTGGEFCGTFLPEIDIAYFDIAAVLVGRYKYPYLVVVRRLESFGEGDGLSLVQQIWIERSQTLANTFGHVQLRNRSVSIEFEFFHRHGTGEAATAGESTVVIKEVGLASKVDHSRVIGKCPSLCRHHYSPVLPRPFRALASRVADVFRQGTTRPE